MSKIYLAIDPGREKVGLVLGESPTKILWQKTVDRGRVISMIEDFLKEYPGLVIILGDGTASSSLKEDLEKRDLLKEFSLVDEAYSTREGRLLYFKENPPRGIRRLLPISFQHPPGCWDEYSARILLQRFFDKKNQ